MFDYICKLGWNSWILLFGFLGVDVVYRFDCVYWNFDIVNLKDGNFFWKIDFIDYFGYFNGGWFCVFCGVFYI